MRGKTESFDVNNVRVFVDKLVNGVGNGVYDAGDTELFIDELAADTSRTVFVVADIPLGKVTNDAATVILTAKGFEGGTVGTQGAALVQTTGANTAGVDTVFADGAGSTDALRDAAYSAKADYVVSAAALTVTKVSRIVSDPSNGTTNPKAIPGATIEYCISVANASGGADATGVAINDVLPTTTAFVSGSIKLNGTVNADSTCKTDGSAGDGAYASGAVTGTLGSVAAGATRTALFQVTIK